MSKKARRRHKPTDPAEIARLAYIRRMDPASWGLNVEALRGEQNADVAITEATREKTARVQRFDCFVTLKVTVEQHQAVRRYQDDLAIRYGCEGSARSAEHVDGGGAAELVSQRSIDAAKRLDALADLMDEPWMLTLIHHLSEPMVLRGERVNWKAIVRKDLGLIDRDAQARAVKTACEGVRRGWEAFDKKPMRRAA